MPRVWSLAVLVAIMFLLVAKLAALQRADVIAELAEQVAHGETSLATSAVRNLARIPRPPLAVLVAAAASPNLAVAQEAQHAIDDYLRFCRREIRARRGIGQIAAQLTALTDSLADQQYSFARADHPWVERTTRNVMLLANQITSRNAPRVAERCDEILATISATQAEQAAGRPVTRPAVDANLSLTPTGRDQRLAALAAEPWTSAAAKVDSDAGSARDGDSSWSTTHVTAIPLSVSAERPEDEEVPSEPRAGDEEPRSAVPPRERESDWQAQWSHPVLRTLPARPIPTTPASKLDRESVGRWSRETERGQAGTLRVIERGEAPSPEPYVGVDSRRLLANWLVAEGSDVYPLEAELTRRGFGRLSARLVEPLFSNRAEDRLRLVDEVLTAPGVDPRPWLMLLADDSDSDVRLVVVTIMATSSDRRLVEKAWQVAIHDQDPRIAGLADRLRERRGEMLRR